MRDLVAQGKVLYYGVSEEWGSARLEEAQRIIDRYNLYPSAMFPGPAIIEEKESTLIIGEGSHVRVDDYGFLWVDMKEVI